MPRFKTAMVQTAALSHARRAVGIVFDHSTLPDGSKIETSEIDKINYAEKWFKTASGTVYHYETLMEL